MMSFRQLEMSKVAEKELKSSDIVDNSFKEEKVANDIVKSHL